MANVALKTVNILRMFFFFIIVLPTEMMQRIERKFRLISCIYVIFKSEFMKDAITDEYTRDNFPAARLLVSETQ